MTWNEYLNAEKPELSYITKDSGAREDFSTGARRDVQSGKPRFELIPVEALERLATLYARGAEKYGEHNWQRGMPFSRVAASLLRHAYAWLKGDREEDHLAAVAWNAFALMAYEAWVSKGRLPPALDDVTRPTHPETSASGAGGRGG